MSPVIVNRKSIFQVKSRFLVSFFEFRKSNQEFSSVLANLIQVTEIRGNRAQVRQLQLLEETLSELERLIRQKEKILELSKKPRKS